MHSITIDSRLEMITVAFTGTVHIAERAETLPHVLSLLGSTGFRRVLIDFSQADLAIDAFAESNAFASRLAFDPLLRHSRIAEVIRENERLDPVVAMLASARGFTSRRFTSSGAAMRWLMDDQSNATTGT